MKRTLLRAVTVAACTLALAAPISAARAETQIRQDPRGDVATISKAAGRDPGIDIRKVVNTLAGDTLRMRMKVPNHARDYNTTFEIKTGRREYYGVSVDQSRGGSGAVSFFSFSGHLKDVNETKIECDGLSFETRKANVIVTLNRSCIDGANHVRIATTTARFKRNRFQVDDAWQGARYNPGRDNFQFGPRLNLT